MRSKLPLDISCLAVIQALIAQVQQGLHGADGTPEVDLSPIEGALVCACIAQDPAQNALSGPGGKRTGLAPAFIRAYYEFAKGYRELFRTGTDAMALPIGRTTVEAELHVAVFGASHPTLQLAGSKVRQALAVAEWNVLLCEGRVAALHFFSELLPSYGHPGASLAAKLGLQALYQRAQARDADYLRLVVMLGDDEVLAAARKRTYDRSFAPQFEVISNLSVDRRHPTWWASQDDDELRAELKALSQGCAANAGVVHV